MNMERECKSCKRTFTPKRIGGRHKGIFCSSACKIEASHRYKDCENCSKKFVSRWKSRFCSRACAYAAQTGKKNPSWKGGKVKRECATCGQEYLCFPSVNSRFCSKKCSRPGAGRNADANPNWRGGMVTLVCANCNKEFQVSPSRANSQVYCSNECFWAHSFPRGSKRWRTRFGMSGTKSGKRPDIGIYVRSAWEANYARYLDFLISLGAVEAWEYEKKTFLFPVSRGTRSYTPDFMVKWKDGSIEYHEVKGWMHPKGKTALDRMARYHKEIKVVLIGKKEYRVLSRQYRNSIPGWAS